MNESSTGSMQSQMNESSTGTHRGQPEHRQQEQQRSGADVGQHQSTISPSHVSGTPQQDKGHQNERELGWDEADIAGNINQKRAANNSTLESSESEPDE